MNLSALLADCYRRLNYAASPDSTVTTRLTAFLNETQQEVLAEPGMDVLLNDSATFASVASTPEYSLAPSIARIKPPIQDRTNLIDLYPISEAEWRGRYPSPTAVTGLASNYVDLGYAGVSQQPADASELFVKSTDNATDVGGAKKAYIEGYLTGGYYRTANVAVNGTTGASFGALITSWITVTKFYVDFTPVGSIVLLEDSAAGTELARIGIGQTLARYRRIALSICPSAAVTYYVDYERDVPDMANANDEPVLPPRFHRLLVAGAMAKEWEKQDDPRALTKRQELAADLRKLKFFLYSQSAGTPNLRGSVVGRRASRLGAWYGVDRW